MPLNFCSPPVPNLCTQDMPKLFISSFTPSHQLFLAHPFVSSSIYLHHHITWTNQHHLYIQHVQTTSLITKLTDSNPNNSLSSTFSMTHHCLHGQATRYLTDYLTPSHELASYCHLHSANQHQVIIPCCRFNTYGRQALSIAFPTVWNSLSDELRDPACDSGSFKWFLKTILFSLY